MNLPIRRVFLRLLYACALFLTQPAWAQLSVDVEVDVTELDGLFTYEYTITNSILSATSANVFFLDVADGSDVVLGEIVDATGDGIIDATDESIAIRSLEAPAGWLGEYQPFTVEFDENFAITGVRLDGNGDPVPNTIEEIAYIAGNGLDCSDASNDISEGESLSFTIESPYGPEQSDYFVAKFVDTPDFGPCGGLLGEASGMVLAPSAPPVMAPSLACDLDGDGDCDLVDLDELSVAIVGTSADLKYDLDGNGRVDQSDIDAFLAHEEVSKLNGDSDFNGLVEFADFLVISGGFGGQGRPWSQGDFVADGAIDFADFLVISGNFGQSAAASAVPEPQAVWLFLGGICVLFHQRRKMKVMQVTN